MSNEIEIIKPIIAQKKSHYNDNQNKTYKPEYCQKILQGEFFGLFNVQIASKLGVTEQCLYKWARNYPEFFEALTLARQNCAHRLLSEGLDNIVMRNRDHKLNEKTLLDFLKLNGVGRRLPALKGVENEHDALAIVQDAIADGEILADHGESIAKILNTKLEARKVLDMQKDIELIKQKLGIE